MSSNQATPGAIDVVLADEAETEQLGRHLARWIMATGEGATLFLRGELGMGKTTFSRGLIRGLGHHGAVKSPTYTLVEPYEHLVPPTYHFDLYRLGDPEELEFMGIRDYFQAGCICLIEWPERGAGVLPEADLQLTLSKLGAGRQAHVEGKSDRGERLVRELGSLVRAHSDR